VKRALAEPGKYHRLPGADMVQEFVECCGDIQISEVERLVRVLCLQEKSAIGCLSVSWGPHVAGAVEGTRLALREELIAPAALRLIGWCIPAVALQIGRGMDVKDGRCAGLSARNTLGKPLGGIVRNVRARDPRVRLHIVGSASRRLSDVMTLRRELVPKHAAAELINGERAAHHQQGQDRDRGEEAAGALWRRRLGEGRVAGNRSGPIRAERREKLVATLPAETVKTPVTLIVSNPGSVHFLHFVTLASRRPTRRDRGLPGRGKGRIARFEGVGRLAAHSRGTGGEGNRPGRREGDNEGDSLALSPFSERRGRRGLEGRIKGAALGW
jgi:hypothetical protein